MRKLIVLSMLAMVPSVAFHGEAVSDEEQVREARAGFNDAIARHDVAAIISFLDQDYQITTGSGKFSRGIDRERETWSGIVASHEDIVYVRSPQRVEVSPQFPQAYEVGTWTGRWTTSDGPQRYAGHYAAYWRKSEGRWKVRSELFVTLECDGPECPESAPISGHGSGRPDIEYVAEEDSPYPFSEAVRVGKMLYLSGQIGIDPETSKLVTGGIEAETRQTMDNIGRTLAKLGATFDHLVKCTVMIEDMGQWPAMNAVYATYFRSHYPARSALGADGLPLGALVEIECWARLD